MRMRSRSRRPHASLALGTMEETTDDEAAGYRPRPCSGLRQELLECLRESDCVKVHGFSPKECLQEGKPGQNKDCRPLQVAFFECKRSLLDNRQRFRGRKGY